MTGPLGFLPHQFEKLSPDERSAWLAGLPENHPIFLLSSLLGISREQLIGKLLLLALERDPTN